MMNDKRERIINRIKKLLSVTEERGASENEAIAAALQAQRLIAEYEIGDYELFAEGAPELVTVTSEWQREKSWRGWLAQAIADNFRCKSYRTWRKISFGGYARRETRRAFYGYDMDANAALLTFEKLVKIGERLAGVECRKARAEYGTAVGVENNYLIGFVNGVKSELEKQAQALLVVTPPEVEDGFEDIRAGFSTSKPRGATVRADYFNMQGKGFDAGRESVRASRLGVSEARLLA